MSAVLVRKYDEPVFNKKEILRYMGCKEASPEILQMVDACIEEARPKLTYKVCYSVFDVKESKGGLDLSFMATDSRDLAKNLADCKQAVLLAATVGLELDRLIAKYGRISPVKALCFQAIGAERIESLCDAFNDEVETGCREKGLFTRPRFSPGYGDWGIEAQRSIFTALDCSRKIGLSLNQSLLMSPSKSVTALIGISSKEKPCDKKDCAACSKTDCTFRR